MKIDIERFRIIGLNANNIKFLITETSKNNIWIDLAYPSGYNLNSIIFQSI